MERRDLMKEINSITNCKNLRICTGCVSGHVSTLLKSSQTFTRRTQKHLRQRSDLIVMTSMIYRYKSFFRSSTKSRWVSTLRKKRSEKMKTKRMI